MIGAVGDLVEDVVVQLGGPINAASDTDAVVSHRRGGSAANVTVAAAAIDGAARFVGAVGADRLGDELLARLAEAGVDFAGRRIGRTGTIVVLVDQRGERTMLSDRGSSTAVIEAFGIGNFDELLHDLEPDIVFANEDEATVIGTASTAKRRLVVHGPRVATVVGPGGSLEVRAHDLGAVADSTGAGDAFAAGFLSAVVAGAGDATAARAGHDAARRHLRPE